MKIYVTLLSVVLATAVASTAQAAHARHHHVHRSAEASSTDWAGNPHMTLTQNQSAAFFRDAMNPMGARW
jgi:phage regulator Rha-like protein